MIQSKLIAMSKGNLAVKVLRENFIKKHQVHPDYFTLGERPFDEEAFTDRELYYPKEFLRKNHHQGQGRLFPRPTRESPTRIPSIKIELQPSRPKPSFKLLPKSCTPTLIGREEGRLVSTHSSVPSPPSYVKAEKLRRQVVSAREPRRPLPKYSAYIMKPCNVAPAPMQPRPHSALTRRKSQELNKYMGFGLRRPEQEKPRCEQYLQPWETEYDEL